MLDTVYDQDLEVQAACVRQLRDRHLTGTKTILIKMGDSPHEVVRETAETLIELLEDEDHSVRAGAAEALQYCPTAEVQEALQHATGDRSAPVQNAAKSSLSLISSLSPPEPVLSPTNGKS